MKTDELRTDDNYLYGAHGARGAHIEYIGSSYLYFLAIKSLVSSLSYDIMVKVAIAGGTGDVGRTIVEVIQNDSKHEAIVLTRKVSQPRKESQRSIA